MAIVNADTIYIKTWSSIIVINEIRNQFQATSEGMECPNAIIYKERKIVHQTIRIPAAARHSRSDTRYLL